MRMKLYYRKDSWLRAQVNRDFQIDEICALLDQLAARGIQVETVETSALSDEALRKAYLEAVMPAVWRKYRVRQVFGSKRHPGSLFGKGVPALVVYERADHAPIDVYPHEEDGRLVTIREFLKGLLEGKTAHQQAWQAAAQMDELRARLGPIGFRVSELIREGRRR